jgi:hypothetical protein
MQVELEEHDGSGGGVRRVALTVRGLTPAGYLLATDSAGARFELHPDGKQARAPGCAAMRAVAGGACLLGRCMLPELQHYISLLRSS